MANISDRLVAIYQRQHRPHSNPDSITKKTTPLTPGRRDTLKAYQANGPLRQLEILRKARNRVAQGWVTGEIALDDHGQPVPPEEAAACQWCMSGAIQAAAYETGAPSTIATQNRIKDAARTILAANLGSRGFRKADPIITLASLNDNIIADQGEAIEFFDKAIAVQEEVCRTKGLL